MPQGIFSELRTDRSLLRVYVSFSPVYSSVCAAFFELHGLGDGNLHPQPQQISWFGQVIDPVAGFAATQLRPFRL